MYIVSGAAIWLIDNKMNRSAMMTMIDGKAFTRNNKCP